MIPMGLVGWVAESSKTLLFWPTAATHSKITFKLSL